MREGGWKKERVWRIIAAAAAVLLAAAAAFALIRFKPWEAIVDRLRPEERSESESETPEEPVSTEPEKEPLPVEAVVFTESEIILEAGSTYRPSYRVTPSDGALTGPPMFYSKDKAIASVTEDGVITANRPGTTVIRLFAGTFMDQMSVTVRAGLKAIELNDWPEEMNVGEEALLTFQTTPDPTTDELSVYYSVSDESMAAVDAEGRFKALRPGEVTVTLSVNEYVEERVITIYSPLTGISVSTAQLTVKQGDSVKLPLSFYPADTTDDKTTVWTSSNPAAASVDPNGNVFASGAGTAIITASCGDFTASCRITVVVPVTGVGISASSLTVEKGGQATLSAWVAPSNTTEERFIHWSSDNIAVARVENGVVTGLSGGTATITASHNDFTASCTVFVNAPITGVSIDQTEISILERSSAALTATISPADTTDPKTVTWTTEDPSVAVIDERGVLTAVGEGVTTVRASAGSVTASASVTVAQFIEVESVTLDQTALSFGGARETAQLMATVLPQNASEQAVIFSSSDNTIATVSPTGLVTSVRGGDCVITASCGEKTAQVSVHVEGGATVIVLDPGHCSEHHGATYAGVLEENINMAVAVACKNYLLTHYAGIEVYLTHDTVQCAYPGHSNGDDLAHRCQFAQDMGAEILVSLHHNMSVNHNASGCVAFVSSSENVKAASRALAESILAEISARTGLKNRGLSATVSNTYFDEYGNPLDYYAINRHAANRGIPGVIIEHCFMDVDTQYILSDEWLTTFGVADAVGIANYLGLAAK